MTHRKPAPTGRMSSLARSLDSRRSWARADSPPGAVATPVSIAEGLDGTTDDSGPTVLPWVAAQELPEARVHAGHGDPGGGRQRWVGAGASLVALAGLALLIWQPALLGGSSERAPATARPDRPLEAVPVAAPAQRVDLSGWVDQFAGQFAEQFVQRLGLGAGDGEARETPALPAAAPARDAVGQPVAPTPVPHGLSSEDDGVVDDPLVDIKSRFDEPRHDLGSADR